MKKLSVFNKILIIIIGFISLYFTIIYIQNNNLINFLISIALIPLTLVPTILNKMLKYKLSNGIILIYLLFIIFSVILGSLFNFYDYIPIYDKILHFVTGILSSLFAIIILKNFGKYGDKSIGFNLIFMLAITCAIALLWEVFEYISDYLFSGNAQRHIETGVHDTMQDMISSLVGFIIFTIFYIVKKFTLFNCEH